MAKSHLYFCRAKLIEDGWLTSQSMKFSLQSEPFLDQM